MAVTQYIGARYVPMFYTASDNSNDWEAGVQYEALTVVTYLNQSYTSKIPVPASVGDPASNPDYWIMTGAYNAQVALLQNDMIQAQSDISALQSDVDRIDPDDDCWIFVSDSYGGEYGNPVGDHTTIWTELENKLNMGSRAYFCTFVASGFNYNPGNGTFLDKLQANASAIAGALDIDKVTKVIVVAGRNDYLSPSESDTLSAMATFDAYVKSTYVNAKTYYGYIANGDNSSGGTKADQILHSYAAYRRCNEFGGIYLNGVEAGIHVLNGLSSDGIHPSVTGKKAIANAVYEALETGSYSASFGPNTATVTARTANGFSFVGGYELELNELVENNSLYVFADQLVAGIHIPSQNFAAHTAYSLTFADVTSGYLRNPFGLVCIPVTVEINNDPVVGDLIIKADGGMALSFRPTQAYTAVTALTFTGYDNMDIWPIVYC